MKRTQLPPRKKPLKRVAIKRKPKGTSSIDRLLGEGLISKASTFKSRPKIRKRAKKKPGEQTQIELFREILSERKPVCEVCSMPISNVGPINFSHLLPKGSYRKMKSDKRNIRIQCDHCHAEWHLYGPAKLCEQPHWKKTCALYYELRDEANEVAQKSQK